MDLAKHLGLAAAGVIVSNADLQVAFGKNQGGIRYRGSTKTAITRLALVIKPPLAPGQRSGVPSHPYKEKLRGRVLTYTGEGLVGDQKMGKGNLALLQHMARPYPLFAFRRLGSNRYLCLGEGRVTGVREIRARDDHGQLRRTYVFRLALAASPRGQVLEGAFQAAPRLRIVRTPRTAPRGGKSPTRSPLALSTSRRWKTARVRIRK
jgi:hypothetical protein